MEDQKEEKKNEQLQMGPVSTLLYVRENQRGAYSFMMSMMLLRATMLSLARINNR